MCANLRVPFIPLYSTLFSVIQRYSGIIPLYSTLFASLEPPGKTITNHHSHPPRRNLFYFVRFHIFYVQDWKMLNEKKSWCDLLLTPPFGIWLKWHQFYFFVGGGEIYGLWSEKFPVDFSIAVKRSSPNIKKLSAMIYLISSKLNYNQFPLNSECSNR